MTWLAIVLTSVGCYLFKLAGVLVPRQLLDHPTVARVAALLPVALLSALAAVQMFAIDSRLVVDARLAGVAAGVVALVFRAPFLVVVFLAAATAAAVRALQG